MASLSFTFWGVRGSIPSPGPSTSRYGGNTSCVEVRTDDHLVVFDMGSGLRPLGQSLAGRPVEAAIFLSHYHWDHLQGLPFFGPAYAPQNALDVHAPARANRLPEELLSHQMTAPFFPVPLSAFRAKLSFQPIASGDVIPTGPARVTARELNHPDGVLGFRLEALGKTLVFATDHEHGTASDQALVDLARDADALIYDAMYSPAEYAGLTGMPRTGWGHSTWEAGVDLARRASVKRLFLFHHEPARTDDDVDALLADCRARFPDAWAAREGDTHEA